MGIVILLQEAFKIESNSKKFGQKVISREISTQTDNFLNSSFKTLDNTLRALLNMRVLVRLKLVHYSFLPAQLQLLRKLNSLGSKVSKSIDITIVDKVQILFLKRKKFIR